jgi:hypothetical protein
VRPRFLLAAAALLAACGGGGPAVSPVGSSSEVVREFMKAAADSNVSRMGQLWGDARGPASETRSIPGWERRLIVMQVYLRGDSARIESNTPDPGDSNRRRLSVTLFRMNCATQIPFTSLRTKSGNWVIFNVELAKAGNPARPCEPGTRP